MIGLILLGFAGAVAGLIGLSLSDGWLGSLISILGVLSGVVLMLLGLLLSIPDDSETVEYPASEYTLELKVTEYQGQKDTTYVLIPKETIK